MKQSNVKEFLTPNTLQAAIEMYKSAIGKAKYIAGATDLFATDDLSIDILIDITDIGINYIKKTDDGIHIGAGATFSEISKSEIIKNEFTALYNSAKVLADMTVRNVATLGGNIATALPSGDGIPPLYVCDAKVVLVSDKGERTVSIKDFFKGPRQTVLADGEIIKEFIVKPFCKTTNSGSCFVKVGRNAVDIAIVNVAASITVDDKGIVTDADIALGAVGPTVMCANKLSQSLIGEVLTEELIELRSKNVAEEISPISNVRSTAQYRSDVSKPITSEAILNAYNQATKNI